MKKMMFLAFPFLPVFFVLTGFCEISVNIPLFEKPPKIDGNLTESCWKKAIVYECSRSIENKELKDRWKAYIGCDRDSIYIGIDADVSEPERILNFIRKRDDRVWKDDCFEIMIDYRNDCTSYVQFLMNTGGTRCDLFRCLTSTSIDPENFDADWYGYARVKGNKIFAEFQIPYAIFDLYGKKDNDFRINICRENRYQNEYSSITGTFDETDKFLVLKNLPIPSILKQIRIDEINWGTNSGPNLLTATITNSGDRVIKYTATMIDRNGPLMDVKKTGILKTGKNRIRKDYTIQGEPGIRELTLSIVDAENGMTLKKASRVFLLPPAISVISDKYMYDELDEKMEVRIKLNINRDFLKTARIKLLLEGKKLLWQADNPEPETYAIVDIKSIPFGVRKIFVVTEHEKIKTEMSIPFRKEKSPFHRESS